MINIIAAVAKNGVIGKDGVLPWTLKKDMARFKSLTLNNVVIMGAETFLGIGRPLPDRVNIVLSKTIESIDGAILCRSLSDALDVAIKSGKDIFICGGESVYRQAMPIADRLYITHIDKFYDGDSYFPAIPDDFEESENTYVKDEDVDTSWRVYLKKTSN